MAEENTTVTAVDGKQVSRRESKASRNSQQPKTARYARLGDRVFLWTEEGGKLNPRPAFLADRSDFSGMWSLNVMTPQGAMIPYPSMPYSDEPKAFHWSFEDFVEPVPVVPALELSQ